MGKCVFVMLGGPGSAEKKKIRKRFYILGEHDGRGKKKSMAVQCTTELFRVE